jgi:hypothetical protein
MRSVSLRRAVTSTPSTVRYRATSEPSARATGPPLPTTVNVPRVPGSRCRGALRTSNASDPSRSTVPSSGVSPVSSTEPGNGHA